MLFMIIEHFSDGDPVPVYKRFETVVYIGSIDWIINSQI